MSPPMDVFAPTAVFDGQGHFLGHDPNEGCEHRTVGPHRAWCHSCGEWCYPLSPCVRCERAIKARVNRFDDDALYVSVSVAIDRKHCDRCVRILVPIVWVLNRIPGIRHAWWEGWV